MMCYSEAGIEEKRKRKRDFERIGHRRPQLITSRHIDSCMRCRPSQMADFVTSGTRPARTPLSRSRRQARSGHDRQHDPPAGGQRSPPGPNAITKDHTFAPAGVARAADAGPSCHSAVHVPGNGAGRRVRPLQTTGDHGGEVEWRRDRPSIG